MARRTFLTKEATHFSGNERIAYRHMFANNFRKMNEMLGQILCSQPEWSKRERKGPCVFKEHKLVSGGPRQVEETSGKADNRLTS